MKEKAKSQFHPLSHPQKRIWYIEQMYPGTSQYNIGGTIHIKGALNFCILRRSILHYIKSVANTRLQITLKDSQPVQYVQEYDNSLNIEYFDFSTHPEPESEFDKWHKWQSQKPFNLLDSPLFYFVMFNINNNNRGYFVSFHHIIADGWSMSLLTDRIAAIYEQFMDNIRQKNQDNNIQDTKPPDYCCTYLKAESDYESSERFFKNRLYWLNKFNDLPEMLQNSNLEKLKGKRKEFYLTKKTSNQLKNYIKQNSLSLNSFFTGLLILYLSRIFRQNDIVVGIPVVNRPGRIFKQMFGMFTSSMPFRTHIDFSLDFNSYIRSIHRELKICYLNQRYPYDLLVQDLKLRIKGYHSLFDICVNYYNTKHPNRINDQSVENIDFYPGSQLYALQLIIKDWLDSEQLGLSFDYKTSDFSARQVENIFSAILKMMTQVMQNASVCLKEMELLDQNTRHKLITGFNSTQASYPKHLTIDQLFENQVKLNPDRIAVQYKEKYLTYRQLWEKSCQAAYFIKRKGVIRGSFIGILTYHSCETIPGILGILKAGCSYVPLDPDYPVERILFILKDLNISLVFTNINELPEKLSASDCQFISINDCLSTEWDLIKSNAMNKPEDIAYVIYTSGSTGQPKGVMITHKALVNYIYWACKVYFDDNDEVMAFYSSLAFDLTITSVFTPLICGAKIKVFSEKDSDEFVIYRILADPEVTIIKLTPSHLSLIHDFNVGNSSIKKMIIGGENFKVKLAKKIHKLFNGNIRQYNEYGPTEATVGCMIHCFDAGKDKNDSVPIGVPADNMQIYILDECLKPLPAGIAGELYISGDGLARGYWQRPDLTSERFLDHPFIAGKKIYKTGDLAKFLNNGKIEYIGRRDNQVKIHGHRIELGEIENYLLDFAGIEKTHVSIGYDDRNNPFLYAYLVIQAGADKKSDDKIKTHLKKILPDYMIPQIYMEIRDFPLNKNGKIDKTALPQPDLNQLKSKKIIAPATKPEKVLISAVKDILQCQNVSMDDNFFYLGGDSIKAIQLSSRMKQSGYLLKVKNILANPEPCQMSHFIRQAASGKKKKILQKGIIKNTPVFNWFFENNFVQIDFYHQSVLLQLKNKISIERLNDVLAKLVRQHDVFRLNYDKQKNEFYYNELWLNIETYILYYDLTRLFEEQVNESILGISRKIKNDFDLEHKMPVKFCVFDLAESWKLLIIAHHLVIDGISWRILLEDLKLLLENMDQKTDPLLEKTDSFQSWSNYIQAYQDKVSDNDIEYWQQIVSTRCSICCDFTWKQSKIRDTETVTVKLCPDNTQLLSGEVNIKYHTKIHEILVIALVFALYKLYKQEQIILELEGHGRDHTDDVLDFSRTIGWFSVIYPVLFSFTAADLTDEYNYGFLIKLFKENIRKAQQKSFQFSILRYSQGYFKEYNSEKHIRFNYLGNFDEISGSEAFEISHEMINHYTNISPENHMTCLMEINLLIWGGELQIFLTYSKNCFRSETVNQIKNEFITQIKRLVRHCQLKKSTEFTPSDFDSVEINQEELDGLFN